MLLIEYGGHRNVERALTVIFKIMQSDQFKEQFVRRKQSWYFPKPNGITKLLEKARFRDIQVNLSERTTTFSDREEFAMFVKTVIMKPFLGYLPNAKKKEIFLDAFLKKIERSGWALSLILVYHYKLFLFQTKPRRYRF